MYLSRGVELYLWGLVGSSVSVSRRSPSTITERLVLEDMLGAATPKSFRGHPEDIFYVSMSEIYRILYTLSRLAFMTYLLGGVFLLWVVLEESFRRWLVGGCP